MLSPLLRRCGIACLVLLLPFGCSRGTESPARDSTPAPSVSAPSSSGPSVATSSTPRMEIPTISLKGKESPSASEGHDQKGLSPEEHRRVLLEAMMPLQVLLGTWHGTTQREIGQFKVTDEPSWVWDFQTDRNQPALVMTSNASPYLRSARLTYLTDRQVFHMEGKDPEGGNRIFEGTFSEPVQEFQGDDQKMHVRYKLQLTQVAPVSDRDQWQIILNQQENNRYLQEMEKKRGAGYLRIDTVATQRQGTSFAKSDAGYGEKECVISGGLGTIQVSYQGKSYWVCCTGCQAAFKEDPVSWIAEYEKKKEKKKS